MTQWHLLKAPIQWGCALVVCYDIGLARLAAYHDTNLAHLMVCHDASLARLAAWHAQPISDVKYLLFSILVRVFWSFYP